MSFLNSVVNQIGRELGRDIYHSSKSKFKPQVNKSNIELLYDDIAGFKPAQYDKVTVRQISTFVDKLSKLPTTSTDVLNLYFDLDEKIDFCKEIVDEKSKSQLENLDKLNSDNFNIALLEYKSRLKKSIDETQLRIDNYVAPNKIKERLTNVFAYLTLIALLWVGLSKDSYKKSNLDELPQKTEIVNLMNSNSKICGSMYSSECMYIDCRYDHIDELKNVKIKIDNKYDSSLEYYFVEKINFNDSRTYYYPDVDNFEKDFVGTNSLYYLFVTFWSICFLSAIVVKENKISNKIKSHKYDLETITDLKNLLSLL